MVADPQNNSDLVVRTPKKQTPSLWKQPHAYKEFLDGSAHFLKSSQTLELSPSMRSKLLVEVRFSGGSGTADRGFTA